MARSTAQNFGLIVAAGKGRRFCRGTGRVGIRGLKQFARLKGQPLIAYSLEAFERSRLTAAVVVVVNRSSIAYVRRLASRLGLRKLSAVVAGGRRRSESVENGLEHLPEQGCVAVHDAARPLVTAEMIDRGFAVCRRRGPATYGYPLTDALKRVAQGRIVGTVERAGLFVVQTPQFFPIELLRAAHRAAARARLSAPDDCALVERLGSRPLVLPGPHANLKVTGPQDLALAGRLL